MEGATRRIKLGSQDLERDICGDPTYVRAVCEASLRRLDMGRIDLYDQPRIDNRKPIEVTVPSLFNPAVVNHAYKMYD
ncbi:hypothetical protein Nepgr_022094 [Nepenthes gracilis]|uniref:Uncharacterized protein n=1 Tax=Nepenthes gracilis TaxID=150966 RepID=A0AAD3SY01_NEPGR|nr:hypothetical protein Nepgr_022094 [Nepenthes gracilis]